MDLEQAKAEVFRRGNARIKKRKAIRRSVIACCVPLVLCVGIWSVTILPAMMPASTADSAESAVMDNMNGAAPESAKDVLYESSTQSSGRKNASLLVHGEEYTLSDEDSEIIWNILRKLDYNPHRVCRCLPKCQFEIKSKSYGLHFGEGYARCDKGQARLSQEQLQTIREILSRNQIEIN